MTVRNRLVFGTFPTRLYKCFEVEEFARDFAERGIFRLSTLAYYRSIEDAARADGTEGEARLRVRGDVTTIYVGTGPSRETTEPGYVQYTGEMLHDIYILCTSRPPNDNTDLLPAKFGRFIVQIDDPFALARDMATYIKNEDVLGVAPIVRFGRVLYHKNKKVAKEPSPRHRSRLMYLQKPSRFSDEFEYRYAVLSVVGRTTPAAIGDHHFVRLSTQPAYLKLLPPRKI